MINNQTDNNIINGLTKYKTAIKNIEGIFEKLERYFNIQEYKNKINQIEEEVRNNKNLKKEMSFQGLQNDYENFIYFSYIKRIEDLTSKINTEYTPFYKLKLNSNQINNELKIISGENINEIIENTKKLIYSINELNPHNIQEKSKLIDEAYQTIYSVILHEELLDRSDILYYIKKQNISNVKEHIGRLIEKDLINIQEQDLITDELKNIHEGLEYDYLSENIIKKISEKKLGQPNSEFIVTRQNKINELTEKTTELKKETDDLITRLQEEEKREKEIKRKKAILYARILPLFLIPITTLSLGRLIGKKESEKITEYQTITRTIDLNNGEPLGEPEIVFDENLTTYVATVTVYTPWRKNPNSTGYIRNATTYECINYEIPNYEYHVTKEEYTKYNEKYTFVELKDKLDKNDSTNDYTFKLTETYQNKDITRKSTKYIIPFTIIGSILGILIDVILYLLKISNISLIKELLYKLTKESKNTSINIEKIKQELLKLKEESDNLTEEYNNTVAKYGSLNNRLIIPEIPNNSKKRILKK